MSRITELFAALQRAALHGSGKGSYLTRKFRDQTFWTFSKWTGTANVQIRDATQINTKTIRAYIAERLQQRMSRRSLQCEMSHIRTALRGVDRGDFADQIKNSDLGLQATRPPGHTAMSAETYARALAALEPVEPGAAAALQVAWACGHRLQEALTQRAQEYRRMAYEIKINGSYRLNDRNRTKGGRSRNIGMPAEMRPAALAALAHAAEVAEANGGYLIPADSMDKAVGHYKNVVRRIAGLKGRESTHATRYAFAREFYSLRRTAGVSEEEAVIEVTLSLGHGSGRGRWVRHTYLEDKL